MTTCCTCGNIKTKLAPKIRPLEAEMVPKYRDAELEILDTRPTNLETIDFVKRTLKTYRTCLQMTGQNGRKLHFASTERYRYRYIGMYLACKTYLARHAGVLNCTSLGKD